jgi:hypothetical protein
MGRHVARVGERKDVYSIKGTLGRPRCRWKVDTVIGLKDIG